MDKRKKAPAISRPRLFGHEVFVQSGLAQAIPTNDRTAMTMTTAPTSHTMLFMFFSFDEGGSITRPPVSLRQSPPG
jgi:hypothetical protein